MFNNELVKEIEGLKSVQRATNTQIEWLCKEFGVIKNENARLANLILGYKVQLLELQNLHLKAKIEEKK